MPRYFLRKRKLQNKVERSGASERSSNSSKFNLETSSLALPVLSPGASRRNAVHGADHRTSLTHRSSLGFESSAALKPFVCFVGSCHVCLVSSQFSVWFTSAIICSSFGIGSILK
eukprot:990229-Rhodomonas_salina.1